MSWWAQKLGTPQQQPAPQQYYPPAQYPQQQPQPQYQYPQQQPQQIRKPQTFSEALAMGDTMVSAGLTKGHLAARYETSLCPECGSGNYFDRSKVPGGSKSTERGTFAPAPICMDCGFRGDTFPRQYGEVHDTILVDDSMFVG